MQNFLYFYTKYLLDIDYFITLFYNQIIIIFNGGRFMNTDIIKKLLCAALSVTMIVSAAAVIPVVGN